MGSLTIRNLDNDVIDSLKAQAKANERSLEAEVRHLLARFAGENARLAAFRDRARRLLKLTQGAQQTDSVALLREDRDR